MTADVEVGVTAVRPGDFRHRAACRDVDPELFFPAAESGPVFEAQVGAAKAVCAGCPVRAQCLEWATTALPYGIAGGLTEQERTRARARTRRASRDRGRGGGQGGRPATCRPIGGTRSEVAAAGRAAIAGGASPRRVAAEFGVTERTAWRWAQRLHASTTNTAPAPAPARRVWGGERRRPPGSPPDLPTAQTPWQGHGLWKETDPR